MVLAIHETYVVSFWHHFYVGYFVEIEGVIFLHDDFIKNKLQLITINKKGQLIPDPILNANNFNEPAILPKRRSNPDPLIPHKANPATVDPVIKVEIGHNNFVPHCAQHPAVQAVAHETARQQATVGGQQEAVALEAVILPVAHDQEAIFEEENSLSVTIFAVELTLVGVVIIGNDVVVVILVWSNFSISMQSAIRRIF